VRKTVRRTTGRLAIAVALGLALACGGEQTEPAAPAAEQAPGQAPAAAPQAPAAPAQPAAVDEVWSATLPESYPEDVPQYPGAEVARAKLAPDGALTVRWTSADTPDKVGTYFSDAFAGQGWSTQKIDASDGVLVFADKGSRSASVALSSVEGKTQIDLWIMEMP
jgi:hypothetical protein